MALTFTETSSGVVGNKRVWRGYVTFDTSYPTGGEQSVPSDFAMSTIEHIDPTSTQPEQHRVMWVRSNNKLKIWLEDATSGKEGEVGAAVDVSSLTAELTVIGT